MIRLATWRASTVLFAHQYPKWDVYLYSGRLRANLPLYGHIYVIFAPQLTSRCMATLGTSTADSVAIPYPYLPASTPLYHVPHPLPRIYHCQLQCRAAIRKQGLGTSIHPHPKNDPSPHRKIFPAILFSSV